MSEAKFNPVLEELAATVTSNTTENQLRSQVSAILCKHLKRDAVDYRTVEEATKRARDYISKKIGEQRLRKTQEYMANRPCGVMQFVGNTPKTNKIEPPVNRTPFDLILFSQKHKIPLTVEIIDMYMKINDASEQELFKKGLLDEDL